MLEEPNSNYTDENPILPVEILPWLFLSDEKNAQDRKRLTDIGVTHVLSVNGAPEYRCRWSKDFYNSAGIVHKRIHGEDNEGYDMISRHWDECYSFLNQVHEVPNAKVVVHCVSGINRSGLIVCAAQMIFEHLDVLNVVEHCAKQRKRILWNKYFRKQLCLLAAQNGLLGDKPEGYDDEPIIEVPIPPPPKRALDKLL
jgi:predicted protein tyrosine phosphatase